MRFPVLQFGTSRFLQAHADLFIHEAAADGEDAGPVAIVASSGNAARRSRLAAFEGPEGYPVEIRGLENGAPVNRDIRVTSVRRGLDALTDWPEVVRLGCEADFLISNVSDAGYAVPADLTVDLAEGAPAPDFFPAKLLALLARRHRAGRPGPVILPTELVRRNGDVLAGLVRDLARRSNASADFVAWLDRDCVFVNSLVDRIVSAPLEPAGAVAEPYALWAIEDRPGLRLPCRHPAIVVTTDLERFERLKLHILNLGHTVLADDWQEAGSPAGLTVKAALADPAIADRLKRIYTPRRSSRVLAPAGSATRLRPTSPPPSTASPTRSSNTGFRTLRPVTPRSWNAASPISSPGRARTHPN